MSTRIEREEVLKLMPHGPGMCLIDAVVAWDESSIHCTVRNHTRSDHPLRTDGRLSALHLAEYAAQAMAVHGTLLSRAQGSSARPGMLVSIRDFHIAVDRIDTLPGPIELHGRREILRSDAIVHSFQARHAGNTLATGRVSVLFQA